MNPIYEDSNSSLTKTHTKAPALRCISSTTEIRDFLSHLRHQRRGAAGGVIMASSKEYLDFILKQLSELDDMSYRAMMGEYIIYYRDKIVGGIYDDRFLVKPTKSAVAMMPNAEMELPYEGAKKMLLVDDVDNRKFLRGLLEAMYPELPAPKKKK